MDIQDIIKDCIYYPLQDYENWILVGVISLIMVITGTYAKGDAVLVFIADIIYIICAILLAGIIISIIQKTLSYQGNGLALDPKNNFINGIKQIIINIVYTLIPTVITLIIAYPLGLYSNFSKFLTAINSANINPADPNATNILISSVPQEILSSLFGSLLIVGLIFFILMVLAYIFIQVSTVRLAETESLGASLNIVDIYHKIGSIGWVKYILTIIVLFICVMIVAIIMGFISYIPYIGNFINALFLTSYIQLFIARCIGLLYIE